MSEAPGNLLAPRPFRFTGHEGVALQAYDYGGAGPKLLMAHCTGGLARLWDPIIRRLGDAYHVYTVDSRGHGASEQPETSESYAWEKSAQDLLALRAVIAPDEALYGVGHSAGATQLALAEHASPGAFSKLMLIEAIIGPPMLAQAGAMLAANARRRKNTFESIDAARERLFVKPPMSLWCPEVREAYISHGLLVDLDGTARLRLPGEREAWCYERGGAHGLFELLQQFDRDILLVSGSESDVHPVVAMQAERLPRARHEVTPGGSHFLPQESPEIVAGQILRYFPSNTNG